MKVDRECSRIIKILQVSGLAPYTLSNEKKKNKKSFRLIVYNLFLVCVIMYNMLVILRVAEKNSESARSPHTFLIRISFDVIDFMENVHHCFGIIRSFIVVNQSVFVWLTLNHVKKELHNLGGQSNGRAFKRNFYFKTLIFLALSIIFVVLNVVLSGRSRNARSANYWFFWSLPLFMNCIVESAYVALVLLLYQRFNEVNLFLNSIIKCYQTNSFSTFSTPMNVPLLFEKTFKNYDSVINLERWKKCRTIRFIKKMRPQLSSSVMKSCSVIEANGKHQQILNVIRSLKRLHLDLFEVLNCLNFIFGWNLLLIISTAFFGCIINTYFIITFHLRPYDTRQYLSHLSWLFSHFARVSYIIIRSSKASKEVIFLLL